MIAAANSYIVTLDNLSSLPNRLSDDLAVLATGGGLGKRQLYSDADECILKAQRPILLNGIGEVVTPSGPVRPVNRTDLSRHS
jgi:hypothetical protein